VPKLPIVSANPSKSRKIENGSPPNEESPSKNLPPPPNRWRPPNSELSNPEKLEASRSFENDGHLAAEFPKRVRSIFASTRLAEIAEPLAREAGSANLRSEPANPRFDAHMGAAFRENDENPELLAGISRLGAFQLRSPPPCQEFSEPRAAVKEELPRFPNECHCASLPKVDDPRAAMAEELDRFPNERQPE